MSERSLLIVLLSIFLCINSGCKRSNLEINPVEIDKSYSDPLYGYDPSNSTAIDLDKIIERGYFTAIVDNSSTGMFLYRGEPMGYEYELLSLFAKDIGVELKFDMTPSLEEGFRKLNKGEGDILAYNLSVTKARKKFMDFTVAHNFVRQVLIQKKPDNWRQMKLHEIEKTMIRNPIDLIGKEVNVRKGSAFTARLKHLAEEIGGDILIVEEFHDLDTEALIELVAKGTIKYTVADEDVALVNARYYPILDVKSAISFPQQIAWGVRKNTPLLLDTLNQWIIAMKRTTDYYTLYDKYYKSTKKSNEMVKSDFFSKNAERLSPYDSLIKIEAKKLNWDWRLLAAQISKESKFDPESKSWVGARGLMQLMPKTGLSYGIKNFYDPVQNIQAGSEHIKWLQGVWQEIDNEQERIKFILASYNVGHGHVQDAVALAKKYNKNPKVWDNNVAKFVLLKSKKLYYEDPVVNFGYCRGIEPVEYVNDILYRFKRYIQLDKSRKDPT